MKKIWVLFMASMLLLVAPGMVQADMAAASIGGAGSYGNANGTWGYRFEVTSPITVTALGVWDPGGTGLPNATPVAIWRENDQTLMGAVVVPVMGTLQDGFRYETIIPFQLAPGIYRSGFENINGTSRIGYSAYGIVWAGPIKYLDAGVYVYDTFAYPSDVTNTNLPKYFGPNFTFNAVPLPAAVWLLGSGLLGLLGFRRKLK